VAIFEDVSELIRSKKLSAWAEMARQVAHEIKNPLTPMKLSAQFMQQAFKDRSDKFPRIFEEGMTTIVEQVDALRRIASEFSNFGRVQKLRPQPMDLGKFLQGVTAPYRKIEGLELEWIDGDGRIPGEGVLVLGTPRFAEGLPQCFRERPRSDGRTRSDHAADRAHEPRAHPGPHRRSRPGISNDAASRLFEPYFSTKSTGTGLGWRSHAASSKSWAAS
jgi:two-component system nitrogen regulation sensor histidine kinase NtrY